MRVLILPIALAISIMSTAAPAPASAQEQAPLTDMGLKFELKPHENGFVRLNKETGEVSFCRVLTGSLICRLSAEEREAYEELMAALETRLELAEERLEVLESATENEFTTRKPVPSEEIPPEAPGMTDPEKQNEHDLDEEFDEAMEIAKSAMRRFFEVVQDLRSEFENR